MIRCRDAAVAIAQSEGTRTDAVLADVFAQCEAQLHGSMRQAGVLVASAAFDYQAALTAIAERFPGIALIGGAMRGASCGAAGYIEDALSLLLLGSDTIIRAGLGRHCSHDIQAAVAPGPRDAMWLASAIARRSTTIAIIWACIATHDPVVFFEQQAMNQQVDGDMLVEFLGGLLLGRSDRRIEVDVVAVERTLEQAIEVRLPLSGKLHRQ